MNLYYLFYIFLQKHLSFILSGYNHLIFKELKGKKALFIYKPVSYIVTFTFYNVLQPLFIVMEIYPSFIQITRPGSLYNAHVRHHKLISSFDLSGTSYHLSWLPKKTFKLAMKSLAYSVKS